MVPRRHDGPLTVSRPSGITHRITGVELNHAQHTTTLPITDVPHNEPAYHAPHHGQSAPRGFVPHPAPQASARRKWHPGRSGSAIRSIISKKVWRSRSPDAERFAVQLPRARCRSLSKANDLAREAVGCNGGLGRRLDRIYHIRKRYRASSEECNNAWCYREHGFAVLSCARATAESRSATSPENSDQQPPDRRLSLTQRYRPAAVFASTSRPVP